MGVHHAASDGFGAAAAEYERARPDYPPEAIRHLAERLSLGLVWNTRDEREPWVAQLPDIIKPYEADAPRERWGRWNDPFIETGLFTALDEAEFAHGQTLDADGLVERAASMSFIAMQPADVRQRALDQIRALAETRPQPFTLPYRTHVYTCTKR